MSRSWINVACGAMLPPSGTYPGHTPGGESGAPPPLGNDLLRLRTVLAADRTLQVVDAMEVGQAGATAVPQSDRLEVVVLERELALAGLRVLPRPAGHEHVVLARH